MGAPNEQLTRADGPWEAPMAGLARDLCLTVTFPYSAVVLKAFDVLLDALAFRLGINSRTAIVAWLTLTLANAPKS
jgi:hypothetical protein